MVFEFKCYSGYSFLAKVNSLTVPYTAAVINTKAFVIFSVI